MANSRVALFACKNSHEGAWTRARGNECGVEIVDLSNEELVVLELVKRSGENVTTKFNQCGQHFINFSDVDKYRVGKVGNVNGTHVKVMLK